MLDFQAARWLMEKEVASAGRQQPSDQHSDRRVQDLRRLYQHRHHGRTDLGALRAGDRRARARRPIPTTPPRRRARRTATRSMREINKLTHEEIDRDLGQGTQRRRRALRPDLFDRPDVRGRAGQASRHRAGCAERREPSHPPGRPAGHAVANAEQNGGTAAGVRRTDRRGACRVRLRCEEIAD